jgi:hypothetical protein
MDIPPHITKLSRSHPSGRSNNVQAAGNMNPFETGRRYDALATAWDQGMIDSKYGIRFLHRAIKACARLGKALDVGCGSGGRIVNELLDAGFSVVGLDVLDVTAKSWARCADKPFTTAHSTTSSTCVFLQSPAVDGSPSIVTNIRKIIL